MRLELETALAENSALREENLSLKERLQEVERQLDWFRRQLFGSTSERLLQVDPAVQQSLLSSICLLYTSPSPRD